MPHEQDTKVMYQMEEVLDMFQTTFERSYSKKPRPKLIFKMKKYLFLIRKDEKVVNVYPTVKKYDLNNLHLRCG